MSYISRIPPPDPPRDPIQIVLEELRDMFSIMERLSLRLARVEARIDAASARLLSLQKQQAPRSDSEGLP